MTAILKRAPTTAVAIVAIVAFVAGGAAGALGWARASDRSEAAARELLFVVDGAAGSTEPAGKERWRIRLSDPTVLWFEDRPGRASGTMPVRALVEGWDTAFAGSPPYAALSVATGEGAGAPAAVELTEPRLAGDGSVSFTATLDAGMTPQAAAWISALAPSTARERGRVALNVDDAPADYGYGACNADGPGGTAGCFVR